MDDFFSEAIEILRTRNPSEKEWTQIKRGLAPKYKLKNIPTNIEILLRTPVDEIPFFKKKLLTKPTRTISGVSPVAIMTKPDRCPHGKCTFCPGGIDSPWGDVPQSYSGHEPATMRGKRNFYDSYLQVINRLEQYVLLGHSFDKIELIIMGGTFPATPKEYQEEFVLGAFQAMNDFSTLLFDHNGNFDYIKFKEFFELPGDIHDEQRIKIVQDKILKLKEGNREKWDKDKVNENEDGTKGKEDREKGDKSKENKKNILKQEQEKNETAYIRCVALCIETKPDWGFLEQGNEMLRQGCTRVELGIESVYDDVLTYTHRGHTVADSKKSIKILRDLGFKINFHYMPGLPLTDKERDLAGMKQLFSDPNYCPDMIKMYPCMVAAGTVLYTQYKKGEFTPISTEEAAERIMEWKKFVPEYCRIQRVRRDVPTKYWEAGVDRTNLRQFTFEKYDIKCRCIRCREPKGKNINWDKIEIKVKEYEASQGTEFFISAEDSENDLLIGFCRLRFPSQQLRPEITTGSTLIRELHVYGTATAIGDEGSVQHKGWGKKLMQKAEEIAQDQGKIKIVVISGVGVREYYKKLGYEKEGPYMVKLLSQEVF